MHQGVTYAYKSIGRMSHKYNNTLINQHDRKAMSEWNIKTLIISSGSRLLTCFFRCLWSISFIVLFEHSPLNSLLTEIGYESRDMAQPIPKTTKQWNVVGQNGVGSLKYSEQAIPELGDGQVLVKSKCLLFLSHASFIDHQLTNIYSWRCFSQRAFLGRYISWPFSDRGLSIVTSLSLKENFPGVLSQMSFQVLMELARFWPSANMSLGSGLVTRLSRSSCRKT